MEIYVDELPKRCIDCKFCVTKTSEPDEYGGLHFQNDQWDTYNECAITHDMVCGISSRCPLKLK